MLDVHRGWSKPGAGNNIDQLWALLLHIKSDRIVEAVNCFGDQQAAMPSGTPTH
ncbi:hypothetical protein H6G89_10290 [Oscillatoria sp. FACHB-1407]|uniref:hypothetical protein n=1 Tax=Oscillatoria sp. FACHB-1407 TaxID=2692847 RepID=UPI001683A9FE|nr:hypothetical protein [Oscillatoria sp. FACHB-1407]MBD2461437.1 hypothetical protein [Oscillatoria sp. FACHB-1407]